MMNFLMGCFLRAENQKRPERTGHATHAFTDWAIRMPCTCFPCPPGLMRTRSVALRGPNPSAARGAHGHPCAGKPAVSCGVQQAGPLVEPSQSDFPKKTREHLLD